MDVDEAVEPAAPGTPQDAPEAGGEHTVEESTGVPAVDAALARLRDLEDAPVESHVEIFDDVQRQLHDALAELEE
ncbi:MAG TPA: hypothetical protein VHE57_12815 [Mycobacteriales bacterium]|nr:hypothetical protein [Mycobacteriales bacterium]